NSISSVDSSLGIDHFNEGANVVPYIGKRIAYYSQRRSVFGWLSNVRAVVFLAPQGGLLEFSGPDAALAAAGVSFLSLIIAIGNGPALFDHPAVEIGFSKITARQLAAILIPSFRLAANRGLADSGSQQVTGFPAAIVSRSTPDTLLLHLRRADTLEAYMNLAKAY